MSATPRRPRGAARLWPGAALRSAAAALVAVALAAQCAAENPNTYNVGGVLSNNESAAHFREIIEVSGSAGPAKGPVKGSAGARPRHLARSRPRQHQALPATRKEEKATKL